MLEAASSLDSLEFGIGPHLNHVHIICSIHFNAKLSLTDGYDDSLTDSDWVKWFVVDIMVFVIVKWRNEGSLEILHEQS